MNRSKARRKNKRAHKGTQGEFLKVQYWNNSVNTAVSFAIDFNRNTLKPALSMSGNPTLKNIYMYA